MIKQFEPKDLVVEMYSGEPYEYYPLGEHVVRAPGVCGGQPTIKYTRIEAAMILALLKLGESPQEIVENYPYSPVSVEAVYEVIDLAYQIFVRTIGDADLPLAA